MCPGLFTRPSAVPVPPRTPTGPVPWFVCHSSPFPVDRERRGPPVSYPDRPPRNRNRSVPPVGHRHLDRPTSLRSSTPLSLSGLRIPTATSSPGLWSICLLRFPGTDLWRSLEDVKVFFGFGWSIFGSSYRPF